MVSKKKRDALFNQKVHPLSNGRVAESYSLNVAGVSTMRSRKFRFHAAFFFKFNITATVGFHGWWLFFKIERN